MSTIDLIRMGIKNLWRRKLRTFLTVLGVIIGTSSIVIMVSLGFGMSESFKKEISRMGSLNIINVNPSYNQIHLEGRRSSSYSSMASNTVLDDAVLAKIAEIEGVEAVTPILDAHVKMVSGRYSAYVSIKGILPETMSAFEFNVEEGRLLEEGDTFSLVFGSSVPTMFYDQRSAGRYYHHSTTEPNIDVLKDRLIMTFDMSYGDRRAQNNSNPNNTPPKTYKVNGVGILSGGDYEKDYSAFMSIHQLKKLIDENNRSQSRQNRNNNPNAGNQEGYQRAMVKVKDMKDVKKIQQQIKDMGLNAYSLTDFLESMQKTSASIQAVLGGIGAISLLVAALGITNTMIMSIYERTKEIGIMKVIGASLSDIRNLFLFEAGLIGLLGGLIGIGFSHLASILLNSAGFRFLNFYGPGGANNPISIIPLWLSLSAIIFTTLVGLVSGFYPARRAMKLSALTAIRTE